MFDEVGVKQSFENISNSRSESNRAIVGGVGAVTLLRNRLNKCMLPRRRISARIVTKTLNLIYVLVYEKPHQI